MRTYGTLECPDCGTNVVKTSPNLKRCKPCALKSRRRTGKGFAEKECKACHKTYKPTGATQEYCAVCGPAHHKKRNKKYLAKLRRSKGQMVLGTPIQCSSCGDDFPYTAGPQHRCPPCQKKHEITKIHEWLASDQERLKKYTVKAKDNYSFGGNRQKTLERDNHTCQRCGAKEDLHVHHIDGNGTTIEREKRNNSLDNLITYCRGCHTSVHAELRRESKR